MVHEVDRVWYAYYKHDNKAKMCNGFMRMQSNSEKKQSSSKDAVLVSIKMNDGIRRKQINRNCIYFPKFGWRSLFGSYK